MNLAKRRIIMKYFIESQFGYCPLVWMLHSRTLNTRINNIHERALRLVYNDPTSTFNQLLAIDKSFTIHERNIQSLAIEIFKVIQGQSPDIMKEVFVLKSPQLYCSKHVFVGKNVKTVYNGLHTISYLGPKIWALIPTHIKNASDIPNFKRKIRQWKPDKCPCRLCKTYIAGVGFVKVELKTSDTTSSHM